MLHLCWDVYGVLKFYCLKIILSKIIANKGPPLTLLSRIIEILLIKITGVCSFFCSPFGDIWSIVHGLLFKITVVRFFCPPFGDIWAIVLDQRERQTIALPWV